MPTRDRSRRLESEVRAFVSLNRCTLIAFQLSEVEHGRRASQGSQQPALPVSPAAASLIATR